MKKSEWSDKQLEELLRQMPKVQDHRHPRDIYQNLSINKRKRPIHIVPYVAAAAALFLFFILVPNIIGGFSGSKGANDQASSANKMDGSAENPSLKMGNKKSIAGAVQPLSLAADDLNTAVYEENVLNGKVLTYWIPDEEARFLIPVSLIDADTGNKTWIELFTEKMAALQEKNWGLGEFYPMDATLKIEDGNAIVNVSPNNRYSNGSTNETIFQEALERDFSADHSVNKIKFSTNNEAGIELGNTGKIDELKIRDDLNKRHAYFFYSPSGSNIPFLVPSIEKYNDIMDAINAMNRDIPDLDFKATLKPFSIKDANVRGKILYLTLDSKKELLNDAETIHSFEALLLTAKEFGAESVVINNSPIANLGMFDLTKEIKVPVAPNLRNLQ